jgi:DNA-binding response OmpR family regulator
MNVVVIEDEQAASRRLIRMLEKQGFTVLTSLSSVENAIIWFKNNPHPELIFLDIQLSD